MRRAGRVSVEEEALFHCSGQMDLFLSRGGTAAIHDHGLPSPGQDTFDPAGYAMLDLYSRVRGAVVCMHTAACLHGLLGGPPRILWLGVPLRVHVPKGNPTTFQTIRWSNRQAFDVGVNDLPVPSAIVRCTSPERTIIDLVRYGRRVGGTTSAARCLKVYLEHGGSENRVRRVADDLRVSRPALVILDALLLGTAVRS
jgi:predicted transcriptional regulator of viral defense system